MASLIFGYSLGAFLLKEENMSGVEIRVRSDSRPAQRDLARLNKSIEKIQGTAQRVERAIAFIGSTIALAFGTDALTRASDNFVQLENRIALVTGRTRELTKTLDSLYTVSIETRSGIDASVETFNRFGRALQDVSAEELVDVTRTIQQAVAISGTGAESARAALFQLGQGLAAGELRGQELNSVLEQTPRVAQAIADSLEVPIGSLRELAEQGALTTEVVFNAIRGQSDVIANEFAITQGTVSQALTNLTDQFGRVIGNFDKITLAISSVGSFFRNLAVSINDNAFRISTQISNAFSIIESSAYGLSVVLSGLSSVFIAVFGRIIDALPRVVLPMRTLRDDIEALTIFGFARLGTAIAFAAGSLEAFLSDTIGLNFEGTIFNLFQARSLIEFGRELEKLAEVINAYGRRWYNVSNFIEIGLRQTNFTLLQTGIYLGILDQKLLAFRYVSFERFGKVVGVVGDLFRALVRAILALDSVAYVITGIAVAVQQVRRTFEAFFNLFRRGTASLQNNIEGLTNSLSFGFIQDNTSDLLNRFFGDFGKLASGFIGRADIISNAWGKVIDGLNERTTVLGKAKRFIVDFAKTVERWFFWVYDKVIGNSWWTDTMEGVYTKALENLTKTKDYISSFLSSVSDRFSKFSLKELVLKAKVVILESDVVVAVKNITAKIFEGLKSGAKTILNFIGDSFRSISEVFPKIAEVFVVAFSGALLAAFSPALFTKIGVVFGLGLISAVADNISQVVGEAIIRSDFFAILGRGLGSGIGVFFNTLISNIPLILTGLFQFVKEFGSALLNEIKGAFGVIPQALSEATFGIFDTLFGAIVAGAGFSILTSGFEKTFKRIASLLVYFTGGNKDGIISRTIFGKDGIRGSQARNIAGTIGILSAVNSILGGFNEGGSIGEAAIAGGLIGYYLFGPEGVAFLFNTLKETMGQVITTITSSLSTIVKNTAFNPKSFNLSSIFETFTTKGFAEGLSEAVSAFSRFKEEINSGQFDTDFIASVADIGPKFAEIFSQGTFTSKIENVFGGLGRRMGDRLGNSFKRSKGVAIVAATLATLVATASQASAATASTGAQFDSVIETIQNNLAEIGYLGLLGLSIFGPQGYLFAGKLIFNTIKKVGVALAGLVTSTTAKSLGSGLLNLIVFGGRSGGRAGSGIASAFISSITPILGSILKSIGSLVLRLIAVAFSATGLTIAAAGFLGILLFGEGDGIFEKIGNFGSALRSAITGTTKAGRQFRRELDELLTFDKVGEIDLDIQSQIQELDLDNITRDGFNDLKRTLLIANRTFEQNQDKFDELGELTAEEDAKTRAAIRAVEEAVNRLRLGDTQAGVFGRLVNLASPENIVGSSFLENLFDISAINERDQPELFEAFQRAIAEDATNKEQAEYLQGILKLLRETAQGDPSQSALFTSLQGFSTLFSLAEKGVPITISNRELDELFAILSEIDTLNQDISRAEGAIFGDRTSEIKDLQGQIERLRTRLFDLNTLIFNTSQTDFRRSNLQASFESFNEQLTTLNQLVPSNAQLDPLTDIEFFSLTDAARTRLQENTSALYDQIAESLRSRIRENLIIDFGGEEGVTITTSELERKVSEEFTRAVEDGLTLEDLATFNVDTAPFARNIAETLFDNQRIISESEERINAFSSTLEDRITSAVNNLNDSVPSFDVSGFIDPKALAQSGQAAEDFIALSNRLTSIQEDITLAPEERARQTTELLEQLSTVFSKYGNSFSLLNSSLDLVDDPISEEDLYSKDPKTRANIISLVSQLGALGFAIEALKQGGVEEGEITPLAQFLQQQQALIDQLTGQVGDKSGKTVFEKFVGSLSESGFAIDIQQAARLSSRAISSLEPLLARVKSAQDAIVNSTLADSAGRRAALATIRQTREEIAAIFESGDVATAQAGYEALGLDSNLVFESEKVQEIAKNIADLNIQLGLTDNDNLAAKQLITREIERQTNLLDILVNKSEEAATSIQEAFSSGFKEILKGENTLKGVFTALLDTVTDQIIDGVVDAFTQAFFEASGLKDTFKGFFEGLFGGGDSIGKKLGESVSESLSGATEKLASGGANGGLFSNLLSGFKDLFGGLTSSLSGLFGEGGFLGSIFGSDGLFSSLFGGLGGIFGGFLGFNKGGIVPHTSYSQLGVDSVPAMLTPGELIVPADKVKDFTNNNKNTNQTIVNLSVTGDISRQTKREVLRLIPEITFGVNQTNRERT